MNRQAKRNLSTFFKGRVGEDNMGCKIAYIPGPMIALILLT